MNDSEAMMMMMTICIPWMTPPVELTPTLRAPAPAPGALNTCKRTRIHEGE